MTQCLVVKSSGTLGQRRSRRFVPARAIFGLLLALVGSAVVSSAHEPRMSYLDNGVVRLGVDLNCGGAITYLSRAGIDQNLVNSFDFGRQIQMSYYSGPVPFVVPGKDPKTEWKFIGWNPIQVGDAFGNPSTLLDSKNDGKTLYTKCTPMHWPLNNVPAECSYECWFELEGPVVHARSRIVNNRPDHTLYAARAQELPAVYTNGPWHRLMTYSGPSPFTGGELSRIQKKKGEPGMWSGWIATESWAALVDDHDFGLGVCIPGVCAFLGGFAGEPGTGGPHDSPTGYIAPTPFELLDWNITHEYRYDLIVGSLQDIRRHVYATHKPKPPVFHFDADRAGWTYMHATDTGWPIRGMLNIKLEWDDPQILSPIGCWSADDLKAVTLEAASQTKRSDARLYWRTLDHELFDDAHSVAFALISDGAFHTYHLQMPWAGAIAQLRLDPIGAGAPNEWIRLKSVTIEK